MELEEATECVDVLVGEGDSALSVRINNLVDVDEETYRAGAGKAINEFCEVRRLFKHVLMSHQGGLVLALPHNQFHNRRHQVAGCQFACLRMYAGQDSLLQESEGILLRRGWGPCRWLWFWPRLWRGLRIGDGDIFLRAVSIALAAIGGLGFVHFNIGVLGLVLVLVLVLVLSGLGIFLVIGIAQLDLERETHCGYG